MLEEAEFPEFPELPKLPTFRNNLGNPIPCPIFRQYASSEVYPSTLIRSEYYNLVSLANYVLIYHTNTPNYFHNDIISWATKVQKINEENNQATTNE